MDEITHDRQLLQRLRTSAVATRLILERARQAVEEGTRLLELASRLNTPLLRTNWQAASAGSHGFAGTEPHVYQRKPDPQVALFHGFIVTRGGGE